MERFVFAETINIGPQRFSAGDEIGRGDIPPGNLDSLIRQGQLLVVSQAELAQRARHAAERARHAAERESRQKQTDISATDSVDSGSEPAKSEPGDDPDATPAEKAKATATAAPPKKK